MNNKAACDVCCGAGGSVICLTVLAWLILPSVVSAVGGQIGSVQPILIPIALLAVLLVSSGLWLGAKNHGHGEPLMVSLVGGVATVTGLLFSPAIAALGLVTIAGAIGWNYLAAQQQRDLEDLS
ncbi:MAG: hypothetical protein ACE5FJ_06510 [Gemmatimonadales bacterium]